MLARFIVAAVLIAAGLFIFAVATVGVFKFKYVLNRMHIAAQSDTLGLMLVLAGVAVLTGFTFTTLKIVVIIVLFWMTGPVSSHMLAKMEIDSQEKDDKKQFEVNDLEDEGDIKDFNYVKEEERDD